MNRLLTSPRPGSARGFTLIELLIATLAMAVLLVALHTVLFTALELRRKAEDRTESCLRREQVCQVLRADLRNGLLSGGLLANTLDSQSENQGVGRSDRLDLTTTTGRVTPDDPWGEVQRVSYYLMEPTGRRTDPVDARGGLMLVRAVQRNLLAEVEEEPAPQPLLRHVVSLAVSFYDGDAWVDTWQSSGAEPAAPKAIRVRLEFVPDEEHPWRSEPLEVLASWSVPPPPSSEDADQGAPGSGPSAASPPTPGAGPGPGPPGGAGVPPNPGGGR